MTIEMLTGDADDGVVEALAEVLVDCVAGGASVGWPSVPTKEEASAWWRAALADPAALTWVAKDDDSAVVGTVRLQLAQQANGQHRADVSKLLVRRDARRRGLARALLDALEAEALRRGRTFLMLDTETHSPAEQLYLRCGWKPVAVVDGYFLSHRGTLDPTTFMAKQLG